MNIATPILAALALISSAALADIPATNQEKAEVVPLVKAELKDPDSAEFRDIKRLDDGGYCGWVNAKNSFGGYAGYGVFFVGKSKKAAVLVPPELSLPSDC